VGQIFREAEKAERVKRAEMCLQQGRCAEGQKRHAERVESREVHTYRGADVQRDQRGRVGRGSRDVPVHTAGQMSREAENAEQVGK